MSHQIKEDQMTLAPLYLKLTFLIVVIVLCGGSGGRAIADGKLSKIRNKVKSSSPTKQHEDEKQATQEPPTPKTRSVKKNSSASTTNTTSKPGGTLASVRNVVSSSRVARNPNSGHQHTRRDRHSHHRAHRRHVQFVQPFCPPRIVVSQPVIVPPVYNPVVVIEPVTAAPIPQAIAPAISQPIREVPPTFEASPNLATNSVTMPQAIGMDWFQMWRGRFNATIGSDFDDLTSVGFNLLIQPDHFVGLDVSVGTLRENGMSLRDHVWIGDANVVFEVIRGPNLRGRLGLGVSWMGDAYLGDAGFNLTAGADIRLNDRWNLIGEGDVGSLGDADFWHSRIGLARRLDAAEWVTGVDYYDIGGVDFHTVFTGLQFRF